MDKKPIDKYMIPAAIVISGFMVSIAMIYNVGNRSFQEQGVKNISAQESALSFSEETVLPAVWGDLGLRLVREGVIDAGQFKAIYEQRGSFTDEYKNLLLDQNNGELKITKDNAGYLLNLLWALGLANKNIILEFGEMANPKYGGPQNFASTAGWTIAKGNAMDHYNRHTFFKLTPQQQALVDKISKGIYRPCCNNSTYFPDCNHGMAMLGLLELMASQGVSEDDMWKAALAVNSYWFPDEYATIAAYMKSRGIEWKDVNPQEILGFDYSSSQGYAKIASQVIAPSKRQGGGGCGIDTGQTAHPTDAPQKKPTGCGI